MYIFYSRNFKTKKLNTEEIDNINDLFPLKDALFIPYIKEEFRDDDEMIEAGKVNDSLIKDILKEIDKFKYIGTFRHNKDFYSDYFDSKKEFINVMFSKFEDIFAISAIFVSSKNKITM